MIDRLTPQERIVAWRLALSAGRYVSEGELAEALWGWGDHDLPLGGSIKNLITKLRGKFRPADVDIKNRYGFGYIVEPARAARLLDLLADEIDRNARYDDKPCRRRGDAALGIA